MNRMTRNEEDLLWSLEFALEVQEGVEDHAMENNPGYGPSLNTLAWMDNAKETIARVKNRQSPHTVKDFYEEPISEAEKEAWKILEEDFDIKF